MSDMSLLDSPERRVTLALLGAVEDAALVLDARGRAVWFNAAAERAAPSLGVDASSALGRPFDELFPAPEHAALRAAVRETLDRAVADDATPDVDRPGVMPAVVPVDVRIPSTGLIVATRVVAMPDGVAVLARDPADAVEKERIRARAERNLLREAVAHVNDLIVISRADPEPDGTFPIVFVNEAFERHTGWSRADAIGRPNTLLDGPGTDAALVSRVREQMRRGEHVRAELLHYTRDGREYWAETVLAPLVDGDGAISHWVAVHRDISDRKRLEEQLFQAQKMEAVGRLAGGVAHDFNNVLTAISGFSELLLEELPPGDGPHEEVLQIKAATARATTLTRQLLAFSRKQILRPRVLDVGALVRDARGLLERVVTEEVTLHLRIADVTSSVLADVTQLEQVLLNLVVNASEAMPSGGTISIDVSDIALGESYAHRHHGVRPGRYVCISVSDTGVGMDRATRERIWEPFFSTKPGGTGLGLSTVYGIVRQSGGHVWVYSEPGTGSTFRIYLPVAGDEVENTGPTERVATVLGGSETILVVEDEALVRDVTRAMLERRGYTVLVARDVDEAVRVASAHLGPIDLLLTDVIMPKANGRRVAERVQLERPGVRVVYMSGYTDDAIVHHGVLEPGIVLLEKPFTEQDLARTVRATLDGHAATTT